jgi:hypothetical protein
MLAPGSSGSQLARGVVEREGSFALAPEELLDGRTQEVGPGEVVIYNPRWGGVLRHRARGPSAAAGRLDDGVLRLQLPQLPADVDLRGERDFRVVLAEDAISGLYERGGRELEGIGVRLMLAVEIADAVA